MALCAADVRVHAAQRIARQIVVELGDAADRFPTGEGMAVLAGSRDCPMRISHVRMRNRRILLRLEGRRQK